MLCAGVIDHQPCWLSCKYAASQRASFLWDIKGAQQPAQGMIDLIGHQGGELSPRQQQLLTAGHPDDTAFFQHCKSTVHAGKDRGYTQGDMPSLLVGRGGLLRVLYVQGSAVGAAADSGTTLSGWCALQVGPIVPWWCSLMVAGSTLHLTKIATPTVPKLSSFAIAYASACLNVSLLVETLVSLCQTVFSFEGGPAAGPAGDDWSQVPGTVQTF